MTITVPINPEKWPSWWQVFYQKADRDFAEDVVFGAISFALREAGEILLRQMNKSQEVYVEFDDAEEFECSEDVDIPALLELTRQTWPMNYSLIYSLVTELRIEIHNYNDGGPAEIMHAIIDASQEDSDFEDSFNIAAFYECTGTRELKLLSKWIGQFAGLTPAERELVWLILRGEFAPENWQ